MKTATTDGLAMLTEDEPGIGGRLKERDEDFVVDELQAFEPSGKGDHLYLLVEKHKRLTSDVVRLFSRHFGVSRDAIGYAGLKDKHAVTRQWFSVERGGEDRAAEFEDGFIRIVDMQRHEHKLRRGKLAGNRFRIKVRGVDPADAIRVQRMMDRLAELGAPNFVGDQRFGYRRDNHIQGRLLAVRDLQGFLDQLLGKPLSTESALNRAARDAYDAGNYDRALHLWPTVHRFERQALGPLSRGASAEDAVHGIDKMHRTLLLSAFQSAIFNKLLDERLREGRIGRVEAGDIAFKHDTHGLFDVEDPEAEAPRCGRLEISPTGPMWGPKMRRAGGEIGRAEQEALDETGVTEQQLRDCPYILDGSRRPFRMPIRDPQVHGGADEHGPYIELGFDLPRGSFATVVLREIMKV